MAEGSVLLAVVALRKESVDRNDFGLGIAGHGKGSLSARRAWIEISKIMILVFGLESLSARRAWIEIERPTRGTQGQYRSLSARRAWIEISTQCRL